MEQAEILLFDWIPIIITLLLAGALLWGAKWLLFTRSAGQHQEHTFPRQLLMLLLCLMSVVALVIALPIKETTETEILRIIGLLLSGLLAFSSTTIVSNLVAGIMMRFTEPFRTGDYIKVEQHAGRVTERGLFDCEIQTENRELVAIPNNFLINNPVTVVRSSGTIISVTLSLGYDVHHSDIEDALKDAASNAELQDPYVHIAELGDYAVTYKISGLLLEVKNLLTARSRLFREVLDALHSRQIEIVSPSFMNQRKVPDDKVVIPRIKSKPSDEAQAVAEDIVFDKAEEAEQNEKQKEQLSSQLEQLKNQLSEAKNDDKAAIEQQMEAIAQQIEVLKQAAKEASKEP